MVKLGNDVFAIHEWLAAALVLTTRGAAPACGAMVVDRAASRQGGALALRRMGNTRCARS